MAWHLSATMATCTSSGATVLLMDTTQRYTNTVSCSPWEKQRGVLVRSTSRSLLVTAGHVWIFGGRDGNSEFNDVWKCPVDDVLSWKLVTPAATWSPRHSTTVTEFDGQMYLFGGVNGNTEYVGDVWGSVDGVLWTQFSLPGSVVSCAKQCIFLDHRDYKYAPI